MPLTENDIKKYLAGLEADLITEIAEYGIINKFEAETEILHEGQYVKMIPIVLKGLVKVFTRTEERELLLYYIEPQQSCIMSFSAILGNTPSRIYAVTEEASELLLLPADKLNKWVKLYPALNQLFYRQYNLRYTEMLDTINALLFARLDQRLYNYLVEKSKLKSIKLLPLRHKQIAIELGTAREVITRVLKRLEQEGKIRQHKIGIEVL
jgi:CRP/FNR family transcriptional regulator, anaerobic regulatory protein